MVHKKETGVRPWSTGTQPTLACSVPKGYSSLCLTTPHAEVKVKGQALPRRIPNGTGWGGANQPQHTRYIAVKSVISTFYVAVLASCIKTQMCV